MLLLVHEPSEMISKFSFLSFFTFISLFPLPSPLLLLISFYLSALSSFLSFYLPLLYVKDSLLLLLGWSSCWSSKHNKSLFCPWPYYSFHVTCMSWNEATSLMRGGLFSISGHSPSSGVDSAPWSHHQPPFTNPPTTPVLCSSVPLS